MQTLDFLGNIPGGKVIARRAVPVRSPASPSIVWAQPSDCHLLSQMQALGRSRLGRGRAAFTPRERQKSPKKAEHGVDAGTERVRLVRSCARLGRGKALRCLFQAPRDVRSQGRRLRPRRCPACCGRELHQRRRLRRQLGRCPTPSMLSGSRLDRADARAPREP